MFAEILIGRHTQLSPVGAFAQLGKDKLGGKAWSIVGWLGVLGGFLILSYYSVIAGWTVYYFGKCLSWSFGGFSEETAANLGPAFGGFLGDGPSQVAFHAFFMTITVLVVMLGVKRGIERVTKLLMPVLGSILLLLLINSFWSPGFGEAMNFIFHVGPIHAESVLEAVGHAFFTLSLGMGAMITYGSYISRSDSIPRAGATVSVLDTVMGMSACVIMFSIIFSVPEAERLETFTSKSSAILFTTLPRIFYDLPFGAVLAPLFYMLVAFAALTSTISILEVVVSYFVDVRQWARRKAAFIAGSIIFLFGVPSALSNGAVDSLTTWGRGGFFNTFDYLVSNWVLPVGGFFIAIFTGWILDEKLTRSELDKGHGTMPFYGLWRFLLRFVCPVAIGWIVWAVVGGKSFA
jgi:NSS family neurotransmitter:Na+ symporter